MLYEARRLRWTSGDAVCQDVAPVAPPVDAVHAAAAQQLQLQAWGAGRLAGFKLQALTCGCSERELGARARSTIAGSKR